VSGGLNERPYLSIGEVLALLLEEFPDVTISKIRFLESQGLIEPERTASGYRKFFDPDVERLRVILREQRENFLPLKVIRDRLETGEIDDSPAIGMPAPRGVRNVEIAPSIGRGPAGGSNVVAMHTNRGLERPVTSDDTGALDPADLDGTGQLDAPLDVRRAGSGRHPASLATQHHAVSAAPAPAAPSPGATTPTTPTMPTTAAMQPAPASVTVTTSQVVAGDDRPPPLAASSPSAPLTRTDLCARAGITPAQLAELESFGLVVPRGSGVSSTYQPHDLAIARAAAGFLARGVEVRHLRGWRQAAEREVGLFEQRVTPLLRQRNPHSREQAVVLLSELEALGADLRAGLVAALLHPHRDV
jgi:DNA-binding transcriptional MerR regulator